MRVLCLLEAPGQKSVADRRGLARAGSGLISADNDDRTAENFWRALRSARLPYSDVVIWKAVPWYLGTTTRIAHPTDSDLRRARPHLEELMCLLPDLVVVMPLGRVAQHQWAAMQSNSLRDLVTIPSWHPSPLALSNPARRRELVLAMRRTRVLLATR
jgi:uracil-DNA glycosylase